MKASSKTLAKEVATLRAELAVALAKVSEEYPYAVGRLALIF